MATQPLLGLKDTQSLQPLQSLQTLQGFKPLQALPSLQSIESLKTTKKTDKAQSFYADYNDPLELNSFADVILNDAAIKKASEKWGAFSFIEKIPIIRNAAALIDVTWNTGVAPILKGDTSASIINGLMNVGETLDVVANPLKGLLMEGPSGFFKGIGLGMPEGRKNYDWNTGNWMLDIGLEIASDPTNWFTFGGKSVVKKGIQTTTTTITGETVQTVLKNLTAKVADLFGKELAPETLEKISTRANKLFAKKLTNTITDYTIGETRKVAIKNLKKRGVKITKDTLNKAIAEIIEQETDGIAKVITRQIIKDTPLEDLLHIIIDESGEMNFKTVKEFYKTELEKTVFSQVKELLAQIKWDSFTARGIQIPLTIYKYAQNFEEFLFKGAFYTSGLGLGSKAIWHLGSNIKTFFSNMFARNFRAAGVMNAKNRFDIFQYALTEAVRRDTANQIELLHGGTVNYTKSASINVYKIQIDNDILEMQRILQKSAKDPATALRAINIFVNSVYPGHNFKEYLDLLNKLNDDFGQVFTPQITQLEGITKDIREYSMMSMASITPKTKVRTITQTARTRQTKVFETIMDMAEQAEKSGTGYTKGLTSEVNKQIMYDPGVIDELGKHTGLEYYIIKYNELYTCKEILNNDTIMELIKNIRYGTDNTIGRFVHNVLDDPNSVSSEALDFAQQLLAIGINTDLLNELFLTIENTIYELPKGVTLAEFQGTIEDALYSEVGRYLSVSSVKASPEHFIAALLKEIQDVLNARLKTGTDIAKQIVIPTKTKSILSKQITDFIKNLDSTTTNASVVYPTRDLMDTLEKFCEATQYASGEYTDMLIEYKTIFKGISEPNEFLQQNTPLFADNFFTRNKHLQQQYKFGTGSFVDTFYSNELGEHLFGLKKISSRYLDRLFNVYPYEYLDVSVFREMCEFSQEWHNKMKYIDPIIFDKHFNSNFKKSEITKLLKNLLEEYKTFEGTKPRIIERLMLDDLNVQEQLGLLQYLYQQSLKEKYPTDFLRQFFGRHLHDLSKSRYKNIAHYVQGITSLTKSPLNSPQRILTTISGFENDQIFDAIQLYDELYSLQTSADSNNIFYLYMSKLGLDKFKGSNGELVYRKDLYEVASKAQKVIESERELLKEGFNIDVFNAFTNAVNEIIFDFKRKVSKQILEDFNNLYTKYCNVSYVQDINLSDSLTREEFARFLGYIEQIQQIANTKANAIQQQITKKHLTKSKLYQKKADNWELIKKYYELNNEHYHKVQDIWNSDDYIAFKKKKKALQNLRDAKKVTRDSLKQTDAEKAEIKRLTQQFKDNKKEAMELHKQMLSQITEGPAWRSQRNEIYQSIIKTRNDIKVLQKDLNILNKIPNKTAADLQAIAEITKLIQQLDQNLTTYQSWYDEIATIIAKIRKGADEFKHTIEAIKHEDIAAISAYSNSINRAQRAEEVKLLNKHIHSLNQKIKELVDSRFVITEDGSKIFKESYLAQQVDKEYDYTANKEKIAKLKRVNEHLDKSIAELDKALHGTADKPGLYDELRKAQTLTKNIDATMPYHNAVAVQKAIRQVTDISVQTDIFKFLTLSPQEMFEEIAHAGGIKILNTDSFKNYKPIQDAYKNLKYKYKALEDLHVKVITDKNNPGLLYLVIDKNAVDLQYQGYTTIINGKKVPRKVFKVPVTFNISSKFKAEEVGPIYLAKLKKFENDVNDMLKQVSITNAKHRGAGMYSAGTGSLLTKEIFQNIYEGAPVDVQEVLLKDGTPDPKFALIQGLPEEVRKYAFTVEELELRQWFENLHYNEMLLTDINTTRRILPYTASSLIGDAKHIIQEMVVHGDAKLEALRSFADSQFSIKTGFLKEVPDDILHKHLALNPEFKLVVVTENKKHLIKIKEIPILNQESIKIAREQGAILMHESAYKRLVSMFNFRLGSEGFLHVYQQFMYIYKAGYLVNPGTVFRNVFDTFKKTMLETGPEGIKYIFKAAKLLQEYNEITKAVLDLYDTYSTKNLREYLETCGKQYHIDYDMYMLLEEFFQKAPVDNISQELKGIPVKKDGWYNKFTEVTSTFMDKANGPIERMARLAMYLKDLDDGKTVEASWKHIADTHFDYAFKTDTEQILEMLFPFITFQIRNIIYWIDKLLTRPELLGLMRDIYTPIWNFDELSPEQLEYSRSLQAQIMNGNISLFESKENEYVLRVNPSVFDVYNTAINPVETLRNKIAEPIDTLLKAALGQLDDPVSSLPIIGVAKQRLNKAIKEQNILPSLITKRAKRKPTIGSWSNPNLVDMSIQNTSNPYYVLPKRRTDVGVDPYKTIGVKAYTSRMMTAPKVKVDVNVYNDVKYKHKVDVYGGIRYQLMLDVNKFR